MNPLPRKNHKAFVRHVIEHSLIGLLLVVLIIAFGAANSSADTTNTTDLNRSVYDEKITQAFDAQLASLTKALREYQAFDKILTAAQILNFATVTNKDQIASRRTLAQQALEKNDAFIKIISDSEKNIRADLEHMHIPPAEIETAIQTFRARNGRRLQLVLQARDCATIFGQSAIEVLDLLEAHWGKWKLASPTEKIHFNDDAANAAFRHTLDRIRAALKDAALVQIEIAKLRTTEQP